MAIKHYMKNPRLAIKYLLFNRDHGSWERDEGHPASHSGKLQHTFVMGVGGMSPDLVIPAGFRACITKVAWVWAVNPAAPEYYTLDDGVHIISGHANSFVTAAMAQTHKVGNGTGVIGWATGNLNVHLNLGVAWGVAEITITYYLVPT